jgi:arabinose-5-phosphate isomerase
MSMDDKQLKQIARRVLTIEADAISDLKDRIDESFVKAVHLFANCKGKAVISGMGKSGLVAKKIAATLASTGTPAFFLHPAEGVHGDLGMITKQDVCLLISYSGETRETLDMLPTIKRIGVPVVAVAGNPNSTLGKFAEVFLSIAVAEEACPLGLAPTASSSATMALGDALAVALLEYRGFTEEDFALVHPAGTLGKKLLLRVSDLMHTQGNHPQVDKQTPMSDAIIVISEKKLGVAAVVDEKGELLGAITDGDLRRGLQKYREKALTMTAEDFMTPNPKTIHQGALAMKALHLMEEYSISNIFVTDKPESNKIVGTLHLHDILKSGLV